MRPNQGLAQIVEQSPWGSSGAARRVWPASLSLRAELIVVLSLLACLTIALAHAIRSDGITWDELPHAAAGYRYVSAHDFRLNPEHPPVIKLLAGLPLLALELVPTGAVTGDEEWDWVFINHDNLHAPIIPWARVPVAGFSVALALLVWWVARQLHGSVAALVALALVAFHPSLIAHGHLVTTDVAAAFCFLLQSWCFYRWCSEPSLRRAAAVALALGLAVATRYTGWILVLIDTLLLVPWLFTRERAQLARALQHSALLVATGLALVPLVIWAVYGFRFEPYPGASVWNVPDAGLGWPGGVLAWLEQHRVLPQAYLEGMRYVLDHNRDGHRTYLLGVTSTTGWWYYHPVAFLVKNTPGFLLLAAALGAQLALAFGRARRAPASPHWLVAALALFVMAATARIQLGERYALQMYPYVILLIAAAVPWLREQRWGVPVLALGLAAHALPSVFVASKNYLAYFNFVAGGPDNGYRWLADSNLDWGQDYPRLVTWLKERGNPPMQVAYCGADTEERYDIALTDISHWCEDEAPSTPILQGMLAVNVNMLLDFLWETPGGSPYSFLLQHEPVAKAGTFFIYDVPPTSTAAMCAKALAAQ